MIILVDSREQKPLSFNHSYITLIKKTILKVGDYGIKFKDNHIPPIYFERKTVNDLFLTLGKNYRRFKKEIIRAKENNLILILIINGTLSKILKGTKYSQQDGCSVLKRLFTLQVKHNVPSVFCRNREEMALYITHYYIAVGKEYLRRKKAGCLHTGNSCRPRGR